MIVINIKTGLSDPNKDYKRASVIALKTQDIDASIISLLTQDNGASVIEIQIKDNDTSVIELQNI